MSHLILRRRSKDEVATDLGFTRDQLQKRHKSAKADLCVRDSLAYARAPHHEDRTEDFCHKHAHERATLAAMKFRNLFTSRGHRFSLGIEEESGRHHLSIPVANRRADCEEHYEITRAEFERFRAGPAGAAGLLERCRSGAADERLFLRPGADRGTAG